MFRSGFFTSDSWTINGDGFAIGNKAEGSDFLAKMMSVAVTDGVPYLPTSNLLVTATTGMILSVGAGFGFKDGYMAWETTDTTITCTSSASEQTLYISARLDTATGEFTGGKVDKYTTFVAATDICFAVVVIPANAVTITNAMITDTRGNATYCGYITDQREYLEELIVWLQEQIANVVGGGIPDHALTHYTDGDDPIAANDIGGVAYVSQTLTSGEQAQARTNIGAQAAMTAGVDYTDPATLAKSSETGVYSGGAVTAQGTPNQTVAVSAGEIITPVGKHYSFSSVSALSATAADATNPRIDIVYVSSTGVVTYLAGTAAPTPSQPATPENGTILAAVSRAANNNTIATADIADCRDFISHASDFEDITSVTENSNNFSCDLAKKHTKNFSFSITNATAKGVWFDNVPYGACNVILTIKATATASVTWALDSRTLVWPNGAPTLTTGYTYLILFTYSPLLGKWMGFAQSGGAN